MVGKCSINNDLYPHLSEILVNIARVASEIPPCTLQGAFLRTNKANMEVSRQFHQPWTQSMLYGELVVYLFTEGVHRMIA